MGDSLHTYRAANRSSHSLVQAGIWVSLVIFKVKGLHNSERLIKKRGEQKQRMVEMDRNNPKMELQAMKCNFEKVSDVSLIP